MSDLEQLHREIMMIPPLIAPSLDSPLVERSTVIREVPRDLLAAAAAAVAMDDADSPEEDNGWQAESTGKPAVKRKAKPTWVSGFCGIDCHEGTSKLSARGSLLKACIGTFLIQSKVYECNCNCHEVFREIEKITGIRAADVSKPVVAAPGVSNGEFSSVAGGTDAPDNEEKSLPILMGTLTRPIGVPITATARIGKTFSPTANGGRQKGQLEAEIADVAIRWFGNSDRAIPGGLTPETVRIAIQSEPKPSNGAIYACFQRWQRQGYVVLGSKPFRIVNMTAHGLRSLARWS